MRNIVILGSGTDNDLAAQICQRLSIPIGRIRLSKFKNGETQIMIEDSVRDCDVYVVCRTDGRTNDELMELLITISACKTSSAAKVSAIFPIFPYSKSSEEPFISSWRGSNNSPSSSVLAVNGSSSAESNNNSTRHGEMNSESAPITNSTTSNSTVNGTVQTAYASNLLLWPEETFNPEELVQRSENTSFCGCLVADLLQCAGADHIITMDLHDPQYQGFFDIPVDNLYGRALLQKYIMLSVPNYKDSVIVSPDAGGAKRATMIADSLSLAFALIHRENVKPTSRGANHGSDQDMLVLVGDVRGKVAILIDDMVDSAVTITEAANKIKASGATKVLALATHGLLSGSAMQRVNESSLDKLVVTNTIPQNEHIKLCSKLEVLDVAPIFAEAIRRIHYGESISMLFEL